MKKYLFILAILSYHCATSQCFESLTILPPIVRYPSGNNTNTVAIGDFNGDGKPDVVASNQFGNDVSILLNNGSGGLGTTTHFAVGNTPWTLAVGDLNGDNKLDVVTANYLGQSISILLGNGLGSFSTAKNISTGTITPNNIKIVDFNSDGYNDVLVSGTSLYIFFGNGTGISFSTPTIIDGVGVKNIGDFNNDGKPDIISDGIYLNNGSGGLILPAIKVYGSGGYYSVNFSVVGDFNNDGKLDVSGRFGVDASGGVISTTYFGNGSNGFIQSKSVLSPNYIEKFTGDFNNDGYLNIGGNPFGFLINDGTGDFNVKTFLSDFEASATADMNGDGTLDFISIDKFQLNDCKIVIMMGGNFINMASSGYYGDILGKGDYNNDGKTDVIVRQGNDINILFSYGQAGLGKPKYIMPYTLGNTYLYKAETADFNNDRKLDFILYAGNSNFGLFLGNGLGGFTSGGLVPYPNIIGDFNNDNIPDIATNTQVFINNGSGVFNAAGTYTEGYTLTKGDFNNDGRLDLLVTSDAYPPAISTSRLYFGDGLGDLALGNTFSLGDTNEEDVRSGDFNADGNIDLIVLGGNTLYNTSFYLKIWFGNGLGSFAVPAYPSPYGINYAQRYNLQIGDFTGDNKLDVVFGNIFFKNDRTGIFTQSSVSSNIYVVEYKYGFDNTGDYNGDGKLDIASDFSQSSSQLMRLFYNCNVYPSNVFITLQTPQPICSGKQIQLLATPVSFTPTSYTWSSSPAGFSGTGASPTFTAPTLAVATSYIISVSATNGTLTKTATFNLSVKPIPSVPTASATTVCTNQTATITATGCGTDTPVWYANNTTYTSLFVGSPYITSVLTGATTYYVSCRKVGGYESNTRAVISGSTAACSALYCFGNAFSLSGNEYIEIPSVPVRPINSMTYEVWVKSATTNGQFVEVLNNGYLVKNTGSGAYIQFYNYGLYRFFVATSNGWFVVDNVVATTNNWDHIACTYDSNTGQIKFYLNGVLKGSATGSGLIRWDDTTPIKFRIGDYAPPYSQMFNGQIDEVRVWNVARTQAEIQANMSRESVGNETGLLAYYNMNRSGQGAGLTVTNNTTATASNANGTTFGSATTTAFVSNTNSILNVFTNLPISGIIIGTQVIQAAQTITAPPVGQTNTISNIGDIIYKAGNLIQFQAGFQTQRGCIQDSDWGV